MPLPRRLHHAYRQARYCVGGHAFRIGRPAPQLDPMLRALGATCFVLITAWNPRSRRMPLSWNARRQAALLSRLRGLPSLSGYSEGRGWREDMLLLPLPPRRGARLGRLFGQAAIVILQQRRPPRLYPLI